jgi:hypothetical protein
VAAVCELVLGIDDGGYAGLFVTDEMRRAAEVVADDLT